METEEKTTTIPVPSGESIKDNTGKIYLPGQIGSIIESYSNPFNAVCVPAGMVERFIGFEKKLPDDVRHIVHRDCIEYKCMSRSLAFIHFENDSMIAFLPTEDAILHWDGDPEILEAPQIHGMSFSAVRVKSNLDDLCLNLAIDAVAGETRNMFSPPVFGPIEEDQINGNDNSGTLTQFYPLELNGHSMNDIVGLQDVKEELRRRVILPAKYPELFRKYKIHGDGGMLLYGPPGNGKTAIAKAIACEIDAKFFTASMSEIDSHWSGEAERNVRHLFEAAREHPLSIIFLDDFDSIGMKRSKLDDGNKANILTELLVQMQGVRESENRVIVIAATNRPWDIDSALLRPGRFDILIHVPLPDKDAREGIFRKNLGEFLPKNAKFGTYARLTEGYSGADIENICERAKTDRVIKHIDFGEDIALTEDDVSNCLGAISSSVDREDVERCLAYSKGVRNFPSGSQREETYVIPKKTVRLKGYQ